MSRRLLLQRPDLRSVAVFRALHLGAMLCAVPALRALRAALPRCHVALIGLPWARQFADRFARYVDEFIPFPGHPLLPEQAPPQDGLPDFYAGLCTRRFALAIQLHGDAEAGNQVVSGFGARAMAGFCRGRPVVRAGATLRPFPDTGAEPERLQRLMTHLGAEVAAHMRHRPLDAAGALPLGALAVLLRGARLLLCNDTGVSHIAAGLKRKSVVIFGKGDVARWAPPDRVLHRCLWDPSAQRIECVQAARGTPGVRTIHACLVGIWCARSAHPT